MRGKGEGIVKDNFWVFGLYYWIDVIIYWDGDIERGLYLGR